ncbi:MAG TPA: hypothetical protein VIJ04_15465 [Xanthobacteraceae bacterium]
MAGNAIVVPNLARNSVALATSSAPQEIASIRLTKGDWIVFGKAVFLNKYGQPLNVDLTLVGGIFIDESDGLLPVGTSSGSVGEMMLSVMGPATSEEAGVTVKMFAKVARANVIDAFQMSLLAIQVDNILGG